MNDDIVIIIPAYNPDQLFINFLENLRNHGYRKIIIIDDGSRHESRHYFYDAEKIFECILIKHAVNLGQGRAYKSGFNYYLNHLKDGYENTIGVIQCDCDGQHDIEDIDKCADLLRSNQDKFILGVRDFSDKSIPFRSRFGNKCTSWVFKFFCGLVCCIIDI